MMLLRELLAAGLEYVAGQLLLCAWRLSRNPAVEKVLRLELVPKSATEDRWLKPLCRCGHAQHCHNLNEDYCVECGHDIGDVRRCLKYQPSTTDSRLQAKR